MTASRVELETQAWMDTLSAPAPAPSPAVAETPPSQVEAAQQTEGPMPTSAPPTSVLTSAMSRERAAPKTAQKSPSSSTDAEDSRARMGH